MKRDGKTVRIVSRAKRTPKGISLRVRAEVLDKTDLLAAVHGTSNVLLLHTDLMGTFGTVSISPSVEQTAYGVFIDLVDVLRAINSRSAARCVRKHRGYPSGFVSACSMQVRNRKMTA